LIWSGVQPCGTPISASGIEPFGEIIELPELAAQRDVDD
jgi:hypothetical protein